ncbi:MAG: RNA polymerase sigma factor [Planctomycetota bacterium]
MREPTDELLRSVWEQTAPELGRLVRALGIQSDRADDVLQDVYLIALEKRPAAADRLGLRRWLFRVTVNRSNLAHRRRFRWRSLLGRLARGPGRSGANGDPAELASAGEQRQVVRSALERLEPRLRTVLVLRYFSDMDSREIGHVLNLPDSTVRTHLRAARRRLALELRQAGCRND